MRLASLVLPPSVPSGSACLSFGSIRVHCMFFETNCQHSVCFNERFGCLSFRPEISPTCTRTRQLPPWLGARTHERSMSTPLTRKLLRGLTLPTGQLQRRPSRTQLRMAGANAQLANISPLHPPKNRSTRQQGATAPWQGALAPWQSALARGSFPSARGERT